MKKETILSVLREIREELKKANRVEISGANGYCGDIKLMNSGNFPTLPCVCGQYKGSGGSSTSGYFYCPLHGQVMY